jgi:hypothetical protein
MPTQRDIRKKNYLKFKKIQDKEGSTRHARKKRAKPDGQVNEGSTCSIGNRG